ncbi:hypothetical protein HELRODRAFT_111962 [Helobdella robusta]|uniref:Major facilitator superfamily (MFS) profile domain-containing protein n=1 Tax=Helobdella robusta TaxID=6412 RepID=T1EFG0_HELRO|nr:hypothetical protein HELRODRAFT_111962 [Helobdella robusta]ESO03530.1 hypothetical protein HELRODRAFT_111962 [Helobdella robusta]
MKTLKKCDWSWMVLFGSFLAFFIADGWSYTVGMLYPQLVSEFGESRGVTSYVITLLYGVPMILSPLACSAVPVIGCRKLGVFGGIVMCLSIFVASFFNSFWSVLLALGIFTSVGLVAVYVSAYVAVTYWFDEKNRGLATGIAVAGSGLGSVVFPQLIEWLLTMYTWRGMLIIIAGCCLNAAISGCLYRPFPVSADEKNVSKKEKAEERYCLKNFSSDASETADPIPNESFSQVSSICQVIRDSLPNCALLRNKAFLLFCIANLILYLWISMPYVYIYDLAEQSDVDPKKSAWILSSIGLSRTVGQILIGLFGDKVKISPNLILGICVVCAGISVSFITFSKLYPLLLVCCCAFGFFSSSTYVLPMICMGEVIGMDQAVPGLGVLQFVQGIATLSGTPLGGWMHDSIGNYNAIFFISGILIAFSGFIISLIPWILKLTPRNGNIGSNNDNVGSVNVQKRTCN